jgi:hypothetical protein
VRWLRALRFGLETWQFYAIGAVNRLTDAGVSAQPARRRPARQSDAGSNMAQFLTALSIAAFAATGAFASEAKTDEKQAGAPVVPAQAAAKADRTAAAPAAAAASKQ